MHRTDRLIFLTEDLNAMPIHTVIDLNSDGRMRHFILGLKYIGKTAAPEVRFDEVAVVDDVAWSVGAHFVFGWL